MSKLSRHWGLGRGVLVGYLILLWTAFGDRLVLMGGGQLVCLGLLIGER